MNQHGSVESQISKALGLKKRPVAVKFVETPPRGVSKLEGRSLPDAVSGELQPPERLFTPCLQTTTTAQSEAIRTIFLCPRSVRRSSNKRCLS